MKCVCRRQSEVREAAGVFFKVGGDDEERALKVVVVELLEGDGGRDGREHGDVCAKTQRGVLAGSVWDRVAGKTGTTHRA